jgi:L-threonylcarbamoyladenylate synthase
MQTDLEVQQAIAHLKQGHTLLYPSDTIWGLGCDVFNQKAVEKVFSLKGRALQKKCIVLVENIGQLNQYVDDVPESFWQVLEYATEPITMIYPKVYTLPEYLLAENGSIAIRWVKQEGFCKSLLKSYKKPLLSTSANLSGEAFSGKFKDIHQDIIKQADYVVNLPQHPVKTKPSTIWEIHLDGSFSILRP